MIPPALLEQGYGLLLLLLRTTALVSVAPVYSVQLIPARVRLAIGAILAFATWSAAGSPMVPAPDTMFGLAGHAATEAVIGLSAGLCARLVFEAAAAAGHVTGLSMGLGYGAMLDPLNGAQSDVIGQLFTYLTLGGALALGVHREAFAWLCRSAIEVPPGSGADVLSLAQGVLLHGAYAIALAIRVAFPVLVAITMGHFLLGVVGRLAPQLGLSNLGFSVAILAGGGALFLVAPAGADVVAKAVVTAFTRS